MPKSNFNKDKRNKIKLESSMSMKERDKIKDPKERIAVAKLQEERKRSRTITAEDIAREKAAQESAPGPKIGGVKIKVRPASGSTQQTETSRSTQQKPKRTYAERKHQTEKLQQYREQLTSLTELANIRVQRLSESGYTSRALDAARESLPESRDSNGELFTSNLRTEEQIKRELSRVMAFLKDPTSLSSGAEQFESDLSAAGLFGGQYRAINGTGYSDEVDPVIGETVLDLYGKILSEHGGWERVMAYFKANSGGLVEYGSENLINAIYDMTVKFGTTDNAQKMIKQRAGDMIEEMISAYQDMAVKQRTNVDYGLIGFDETADDRRANWAWRMEKAGLKKK